jgi:alginate O-acetyltransferase complex protein AlgI
MNVASADFLLLCLVAAVAYNAIAARWWRQTVLLATNLCFLSTFSHDLAAFLPLTIFLAVGYLGALAVQNGLRRLFWPALCLDVALLIWLKRYTFVPSALLLHDAYVTIGLSYICFRMLYALLEARDGALTHLRPLAYLNYTINFLTLVSGPIQSFADFAASQLRAATAPLTIVDVGLGLERIVRGFFKVVLLSAAFERLQKHGLELADAAPAATEPVLATFLIVGMYPLYLYMNFSGYMDIVIGVGRWFRMQLPENFDRPFAAPNFMIFWGRWHITLSTFFRTHFFNPLLMTLMRLFPQAEAVPYLGVAAFFVTFFVLGLWHGQTSEFAVYGLVLGLGVSVNKLYQIVMANVLGAKPYQKLCKGALYTAVCRGLTCTYFALSLLVFWSTWRQLGELWERLGTGAVAPGVLCLFAASTLVLACAEALSSSANVPLLKSRYLRTASSTALAAVIWFAMAVVNAPAPENVYRAF